MIIGDDGSTDATMSILRSFSRVAPFPVTIIERDRVGLTRNFLSSFTSSHSRYVAFADQDDVWLPCKLERSLNALLKHSATLALHGVVTVDKSLNPIRSGYRNPRHVRVEDRLQGNVWLQGAGNTMLFERQLLDGCDLNCLPRSQWPNGPLIHDNLVKLTALVRGRTIWLPDRLLLYRQHEANAAGAPVTVAGAAKVYRGNARHIASLITRADAAEDWARYFADLAAPEMKAAAEAYFLEAAHIMRCRAERLMLPTLNAIATTGLAALQRQYSSRGPSGFGWRALLQDLYCCVRPTASP